MSAISIQDWVEGFEQELQVRFLNKGLKVYVSDQSNISSDEIIDMVCEASGLQRKSIMHKNKGMRHISDARMVAMYFLNKVKDMKPLELGLLFGRDRTTVLHALETVKDRIYTKDGNVISIISKVNQAIIEKSINNNENNI